jgi:hypothetical protein
LVKSYVNVTPGETLDIVVGLGGQGGNATICGDSGTPSCPSGFFCSPPYLPCNNTPGENGGISQILRNGTVIMDCLGGQGGGRGIAGISLSEIVGPEVDTDIRIPGNGSDGGFGYFGGGGGGAGGAGTGLTNNNDAATPGDGGPGDYGDGEDAFDFVSGGDGGGESVFGPVGGVGANCSEFILTADPGFDYPTAGCGGGGGGGPNNMFYTSNTVFSDGSGGNGGIASGFNVSFAEDGTNATSYGGGGGGGSGSHFYPTNFITLPNNNTIDETVPSAGGYGGDGGQGYIAVIFAPAPS